MSGIELLWAELTGRCQLGCVHCYADSGPTGSHGTMTASDWERTLDEAAACGIGTVQFIGGEPTMHPDFIHLVDHALSLGLAVEVFSNLYRVTESLWRTFSRHGVSLATSYYSDDAGVHESVTGRRGSYARTRAAIAEAVARGIPIRVGIIDLGDGLGTTPEGNAERARAELEALGVPADAIGYDQLRAFGRGAVGMPDEAESCGQCGHGVAAVGPDGSVWPCVFTRRFDVGSVRTTSLGTILRAAPFADRVEQLDRARTSRREGLCGPARCNPQCRPMCYPACGPRNVCIPNGHHHRT